MKWLTVVQEKHWLGPADSPQETEAGPQSGCRSHVTTAPRSPVALYYYCRIFLLSRFLLRPTYGLPAVHRPSSGAGCATAPTSSTGTWLRCTPRVIRQPCRAVQQGCSVQWFPTVRARFCFVFHDARLNQPLNGPRRRCGCMIFLSPPRLSSCHDTIAWSLVHRPTHFLSLL